MGRCGCRVPRRRLGRGAPAAMARARARGRVRDRCAGARGARLAPPARLRAAAARLPQGAAADVADRARGDRGRQRLVGRRAVLRQARLAQAARGAARHAHARGAALPRPRRRGTLRDGLGLGDHQRLQGPAPERVEVRQGPRLPRHDHPARVRRPRLLGLCALAGRAEDQHALGDGGGNRAGAELARAGRTPAALRHRRAEAPLPAAPRQGARDPLLRAHQPERRLRCGLDPGLRRRLLGRARGQEGAWPPGDLGQALHHAGPRRDAPRARVPRLRPGSPRRQQGRDRHHLRADPDDAPRRRHRPPPHAPERGVPERPDVGQGRVHSDGLGDRRTADAGPRLADADGVSRRRTRHLSAVVEHRDGEARGAHDRRLRARAPAVQDRDRTLRGHRGGARPHGRQPVHDGRDALAHRARGRPGREARGAVRHRQAAHHREEPRGDQRRDGRGRRQGHLHGPVERPRRRLHADAGVDHRRGREHPHPQPDRLRPGRDPLPSVRAEGDGGDAPRRPRAGTRRVRRRVRRPRALHAVQHGARAGDGPHRVALRRRAGGRGTGDAPALPEADPILRGAGVRVRRLDGHAGRRAEAQGKALRTPGRRALRAVPLLGDAEALRGRRAGTRPTRRSRTGRSGTRCSRPRTRSKA